MRTTVTIENHLLKRLRTEAHQGGVTLKEFLNRLLHRALEERPGRRSTPYRCPTFTMGTPSRPLEKALALAGTLEDEETARELTLRK